MYGIENIRFPHPVDPYQNIQFPHPVNPYQNIQFPHPVNPYQNIRFPHPVNPYSGQNQLWANPYPATTYPTQMAPAAYKPPTPFIPSFYQTPANAYTYPYQAQPVPNTLKGVTNIPALPASLTAGQNSLGRALNAQSMRGR